MQSQMDDKQAFFVQSTDGRKFKMVIRGDLGKLSVGKIRRYLASYGVPDDHLLLFNGALVPENAEGDDFGLHNNAVLHLVSPSSFAQHNAGVSGDGASMASDEGAQHGFGSAHHVDPDEDVRTTTFSSRSIQGLPQPSSNYAENMNSGGRYIAPHNNNNSSSSRPNAAVELENRTLRDEVQRLRKELAEAQQSSRSAHKTSSGDGNGARRGGVVVDLFQNARANLQELSEDLGVPLLFDMNFTSVVGTDEHNTVLITFDNATERLYIYSTILTSLPDDAAVRVKLYELLLEGSILSREVCGGGIGMSLQNGIIMLSTTIPLRHSTTSALKGIMPSFIETIARWRSLINELLS